MKILQVHNHYKKKGGEETVVEEEKKVLEANGHEVVQFMKNSSAIDQYSKPDLLRLLISQRSSRSVGKEFRKLIRESRPDICHVHNIYPLITPVVYEVCELERIPVVQTLHNYKMVCTNSLLFREGEVCELCLNKSLLNSIRYKCYRDSLLVTALQADVIQTHRRRGTWDNLINRYICLTDFQRDKLVSGGLPKEKTVIKPNFVDQPENESLIGDYFLFVGRLDRSKGFDDLLVLFENCPSVSFLLIGESDNPDRLNSFDNVSYLGKKNRDEVLDYMSKSRAVIFPSKYYEGMPMVILEAFSLQKPVIARDTGAMSSMINHEGNGLKYQDVDGLIDAVNLLDDRPDKVEILGKGAYSDYCSNYSVDEGYRNLIELYQSVKNES